MKFFKMILIFLLVGCEATFNSNLKSYIENVSDRSPLEFDLENSFTITNEDNEEVIYYSFDYTIISKTDTLSFTNNEKASIKISSYTNDSQDFAVGDVPTTSIAAGGKFTIDVTYNPEVNSNKTVKYSFELKDSNGRTYSVVLLGTNRRQPLDITLDGEVLPGFDFGYIYISENEKKTFKIVNDGLSTINIDPITVPTGVIIDKTSAISIPIFSSEEISLYYNNPDVALNDNLVIQNDYSQSNYYEFPLYGGKDLSIKTEEVDSDGNVIGDVTNNSYDFGVIDPNNDSDLIKYFRITNNTDFKADIFASSTNSTKFSIDFANKVLLPDETLDFQIKSGKISENVTSYFYVGDKLTGRELKFNVTIKVN